MATVSSAWAKPGAWALDSEEHEHEHEEEVNHESEAVLDFPSLSAAAAVTKKKKPQAVSQSVFTTGKNVSYGSILFLPTGPRERSAQELESCRIGIGGGFKSRGDDPPRRREREPLHPSKADEIDDWGAAKKLLTSPTSFERRASGQSRADESDSWLSKKSFLLSSEPPPPPPPPSSSSDNWGKKRGQQLAPTTIDNGRPRLMLQPRSLPPPLLANGSGSVTIKTNPFGAARPREQVLAEKGQDWKKIDEQLESAKIKDGSISFGRWRKSDSLHSPTPSEEEVDKEGEDGVAES